MFAPLMAAAMLNIWIEHGRPARSHAGQRPTHDDAQERIP
jgi:hypothetical protein